MGIPSEQEDKRDVLLDEKEVCTLAEMEKRLICRALAYTGNNKSEAARLLGITREGLRKKMQRYGLR